MADQEDDTAKCRDALLLKMAAQPPMTHEELKAKLAAARPRKPPAKPKGRKAG